MIALTARLKDGLPVTTAYIRREFGVSKATAKRDLNALSAVPGARLTLNGHGRTAQKRLAA